MGKVIRKHTQLEVYKRAFAAGMRIFEMTKSFPREERSSLVDQVRKSSRSVATNLAEAWRKRRYEAAFISKRNDSEGEAAETQSWIEFSVACKYMARDDAARLYKEYDEVIRMLVSMANHPEVWTL